MGFFAAAIVLFPRSCAVSWEILVALFSSSKCLGSLMVSSPHSPSSFLEGVVLAFGSVQLHVASLKILPGWALRKKIKSSSRGRENTSRIMKIRRKQEVERVVFKYLRSWDGVVLSPHGRDEHVFPLRSVLSCVNTFTVWLAVRCVSVAALFLANLQVHCLKRFFN